MSERDVTDDPLDPELDRLLESERSRPEVPGTGAPADRLLGRVLVTVGQLPPGGGPSDAGGPGSGPGGATSAGGGGTGGATSAGAAISSTLAHPALIAAIALVIGGITGAAMHAALATPEIRIVEREVPAIGVVRGEDERSGVGVLPSDDTRDEEGRLPSDTRASNDEEHATHPDAPTPPDAPPAHALGSAADATPSTTRARPPDGGVGTALSRESSLLHRAQSALARDAPDLAITALREHERRHPEGQLREERDALWISALVASGERDAALARAARFRERYPGSPLQPAIDASLRAP